MKHFLVVLALIGLGYCIPGQFAKSTTQEDEEIPVVASITGSHATESPSEETCAEDDVVVKRAKNIVSKLGYAFKRYAKIMRSGKTCADKHIAYTRLDNKMPRLFRSLRAVFNAVYDQYESPFNNEDPEAEGFDFCEENSEVMKMAKEVIEKLPEALRVHLSIMNRGDLSCSEKRAEIEKATQEVPELYRTLRGIYLAVSDLYMNESEGSTRVRIPIDYNDQPKYDVFEKMLKDIFLYTKVTTVKHL